MLCENIEKKEVLETIIKAFESDEPMQDFDTDIVSSINISGDEIEVNCNDCACEVFVQQCENDYMKIFQCAFCGEVDDKGKIVE
jgi:hypothetical protein